MTDIWRILLAFSLVAGLAATATAETFSHDDWTRVLERFVDERGRVDYQGLAQDRELFDRYVARVESVSPETDPELFPTREHELAYYINAYNALTFKGVLARGPEEESVWKGLISGHAFFVRMDVTVGGEETNLKKLEDDVVRERYGDPRIHAALNCASIGCPRLPREAFSGENLDEELEAAMREFVNTEQNVRIDSESETVHLSKIFDWFEDDFLDWERRQGRRDPHLLDYVNRFRAADEKIPLGWEIEYSPYDKRINKQ